MDRNGSDELASVELSLLLEAMVRWSGYDFRGYAPATVKRRIAERLRAEGVATISGLQERVLHDHEALRRLVFAFSSTSNRLFQTPEYFRSIRERVLPLLRTYSFVRLWIPECSSGEDIYAVAAMLLEEGMLDRCMIYATSTSDLGLEEARLGTYEVSSIEEFAQEYRLSGGRLSIGEFCEYGETTVRFNERVRNQIVFATHSLASDASLNEFHAIVARGVFPLFSKTLQYRVHNLFLQSLARFGFLCLSASESLHATPHEGAFRKVDDAFPIYRRMR